MVNNCTLWFEGSWTQCCYAHDLAYANIDVAKLLADIDLWKCVASTGNGWMGFVMFAGVTLFGLPFWIWARRKNKSDGDGRRS